MSDRRDLLDRRLRQVEERLRAACQRAGRSRDAVTLVAVTKTVTPEIASLLPELGVLDLGENRPQELWRKGETLPKNVRWHMIGHLQRNKIERTLPLVTMVHSVDSLRLLQALEEAAAARSTPLPVLLEVNASREASKSGFAPEQVHGLVEAITSLKNVQVVGLMTMAAPVEDVERCRPTFAALRNLRERLRQELGPAYPLPHLSMGMSDDFEIAVEEGATFVRVGSALFEGVE
jgi:pyridoxal phosphate enzyme (YggS family)